MTERCKSYMLPVHRQSRASLEKELEWHGARGAECTPEVVVLATTGGTVSPESEPLKSVLEGDLNPPVAPPEAVLTTVCELLTLYSRLRPNAMVKQRMQFCPVVERIAGCIALLPPGEGAGATWAMALSAQAADGVSMGAPSQKRVVTPAGVPVNQALPRADPLLRESHLKAKVAEGVISHADAGDLTSLKATVLAEVGATPAPCLVVPGRATGAASTQKVEGCVSHKTQPEQLVQNPAGLPVELEPLVVAPPLVSEQGREHLSAKGIAGEGSCTVSSDAARREASVQAEGNTLVPCLVSTPMVEDCVPAWAQSQKRVVTPAGVPVNQRAGTLVSESQLRTKGAEGEISRADAGKCIPMKATVLAEEGPTLVPCLVSTPVVEDCVPAWAQSEKWVLTPTGVPVSRVVPGADTLVPECQFNANVAEGDISQADAGDHASLQATMMVEDGATRVPCLMASKMATSCVPAWPQAEKRVVTPAAIPGAPQSSFL